MTFLRKFPFFKQLDSMDCGPTCLRMIAKYYGQYFSVQSLREKCYIDREGVSLKGIAEAAENIGFRTVAVQVPFDAKQETPSLSVAPLPCIVHWNQNHFIVVTKVSKNQIWIADPAEGKLKISKQDFLNSWLPNGQKEGIALIIEPTPNFYENEEANTNKKFGFSFLFQYLKPHRKLLIQLIIGLLVGAVFQLIFPFLTQAVVDVGIQTKNTNFITIVLVGQAALFLGQMTVSFVQNWLLLHISTRLNISLIADFLMKLMNLPIGFFDAKNTGDLLQRIGDHDRIERFLTTNSLSVVFSSFNLIVFGIILSIYSLPIFSIFFISALLYFVWITIFLKKRREVDYLAFQQQSNTNNSVIEIIQGMQEIKLQGSQLKRRWQWTKIQAKLFRIRILSLKISQYQTAGATFFMNGKDVFITFIAANAVISGSLTLGMMLAIQYIIGQMNGPLNQMVDFIRQAQDAKISMERLGEIHTKKNEESENENIIKTTEIPNQDIFIENMSFSYSPISKQVLNNIKLRIPKGKITAIVGTSGSGKTTLVKMLLGFYQATEGSIKIGNLPLEQIRQNQWRHKCGVVMQDGYIFSDTIANNITESTDVIDYEQLLKAVQTANIQGFINELPLSFSTMIGAKGNGLSQGQKQRLLLARAVYKDPDYIFLDEATNALDANNERVIMQNLNDFFQNRTVVVVAHRLSTVKNADQIVVLEQGEIVEIGSHHDLVAKKGNYYTLVKNQLELGT